MTGILDAHAQRKACHCAIVGPRSLSGTHDKRVESMAALCPSHPRGILDLLHLNECFMAGTVQQGPE